MTWWSVKCSVCGAELPERGNRRVYVPWKRGFRLVHAGECAGLIEAQGVLDVTAPKPKPASVLSVVRARRLLELIGRENERRDLLRESFPNVARVARILARLDQEHARRGPSDRLRDGLLRDEELVDNVPKLCVRRIAHLLEPKYSATTGRLLA